MTKPERVGHCEGCIEAVGHCEGCEVRAHRAQMDDCPGVPLPAPMGQAEREAIADAIRWASSAASLEALEDAVRRGDFAPKEGK